jgi:hypothetical protein
MRHGGIEERTRTAPYAVPLLVRFLDKFVLDILPAALASVIGGFLLTQYQFSHAAVFRPAAEQAAPASAAMMQLVRDEHAEMLHFLKAERAAAARRIAAADEEEARAAAKAKVASAVATRRPAAAAMASKRVAAREKAPTDAAAPIFHPPLPPQAPLAIAEAQGGEGAPLAEANFGSVSLLAKTLGVKDRVLAATLHAVSAIGGIPSFIAGLGARIGAGAAATGSS